MCSSYFLEDSPSLENIAYTASHTRLAHHMMNFFGRPFVSQGRVKPADIVPVLAPDRKGEVSIFPMVWGYSIQAVQAWLIFGSYTYIMPREVSLYTDSKLMNMKTVCSGIPGSAGAA